MYNVIVMFIVMFSVAEPIKQKSESQDSGLDDKQSFSEGSKSPSQENLASSTVSSCDNIEMSKTLPRNYSLSLLSPTKRPMRTPRTQSDPIKATPREVIEEVAKACDAKSDIEVVNSCERLQPEETSVNVPVPSEEPKVSESASEVVSASEAERTIEEPLRLIQRTEVTLRVNAPTTDTACQTDAMSTPLPTTRHPLSEEIECDELSRDLASQLSPSHRLHGILGEFTCSVTCLLMLMLIGGDLETGILSQPTGKFPESARYCVGHRKETEHSYYPHTSVRVR
jgi:hypothetical protein